MASEISTPKGRLRRGRGPLRVAILERAADLASVEGLDQLSIGRLAHAMQMSKSGLYSYFTSKQDLQLATIDCAWGIFEERVLEPGDDPLNALLERWISYYEQEAFRGGCPFATAGTEFANREGPVRDALAAALERQLAALEHAVARAHATRLLTDTDPRQLAFELHAVLTAANQRYRLSRDRASFTQARTAIARLLAEDPPRPQPARFVERQRSAMARGNLLGVDHVALAVADVGAMQAFLCDHVGMRTLHASGDSVIVGADAGATSLSLIPADGPREPAALARLVLRVADLQRAVASLPADTDWQEDGPELVTFEGPEGLRLGFTVVRGDGIDYDVDHMVLYAADPQEARTLLTDVGCASQGETVRIADKRIRLEELPAWSQRPLLDHIALGVASTGAIAARLGDRVLETRRPPDDDAVSIILPGPERIRLEFIARSARSRV
ncbi:MAG: TetR family transcriptional regulator [Actinobacteria bacterium]|nr:TetR family transcriptional regulator [Actinomycetota bacterium]